MCRNREHLFVSMHQNPDSPSFLSGLPETIFWKSLTLRQAKTAAVYGSKQFTLKSPSECVRPFEM